MVIPRGRVGRQQAPSFAKPFRGVNLRASDRVGRRPFARSGFNTPRTAPGGPPVLDPVASFCE